MAAEPHSSTRRRVLGAAAALPVLALAGLPVPVTSSVIARSATTRQSSETREKWTRRLARYQRLHARWKFEAAQGAFRAANDLYYREQAELSARFGSGRSPPIENRKAPLHRRLRPRQRRRRRLLRPLHRTDV